jgi:lysophospholipase L1-like esterase
LQSLLRRPVTRALLAAACSAAALGAAAGPAAAAKVNPLNHVTPGTRYLAIGDSVSFGYQEAQVTPAPDYTKATNFKGFPEILSAILKLKGTNISCPGETSASLVDVNKQSNGCENRPTPGGGPEQPGGYRTQFPLHTTYSGSQLSYAISFLKQHPRTRLVTLMVGANDFFVCQTTTADHCTSQAEQFATIGQITANVKTILHGLRSTAHYKGQIAIVNYYSLDYSDAQQNLLSGALNQTMDSAAKPYRVVVADGFGEFQKQATIFGGKSCLAGLLTQLGATGTCGVHPSYAGQTLLASAVAKAIKH